MLRTTTSSGGRLFYLAVRADDTSVSKPDGTAGGVSYERQSDIWACQIMSEFAPLRQVPPAEASKGCHSSPGLKAWGFLAYLLNI
jgi:hypothetical protein